jgi:hypothetical protein
VPGAGRRQPGRYRPHLATSLSEALRPFPGNLVTCSHEPKDMIPVATRLASDVPGVVAVANHLGGEARAEPDNPG